MPGSPGYGLHQARDASLQAAKPEHAIEKDVPCRIGLQDHQVQVLGTAPISAIPVRSPRRKERLVAFVHAEVGWQGLV